MKNKRLRFYDIARTIEDMSKLSNLLVTIPEEDFKTDKQYGNKAMRESKYPCYYISVGGRLIHSTGHVCQTVWNKARLFTREELINLFNSMSKSNLKDVVKLNIDNDWTQENFDEIFNSENNIEDLQKFISKCTLNSPLLNEIELGELSQESVEYLEDVNNSIKIISELYDIIKEVKNIDFLIDVQVNPEKVLCDRFLKRNKNIVEPATNRETGVLKEIDEFSEALTQKQHSLCVPKYLYDGGPIGTYEPYKNPTKQPVLQKNVLENVISKWKNLNETKDSLK